MARKVKRTTRKAAGVAADRIERPHGGKAVKSVGPKMPGEAQALEGGARTGGSVRQVGPSSIRPRGTSVRATRRVGGENFEDQQAARGGYLDVPYSRQSGSVTQVGPGEIGYERLIGKGYMGAGKPIKAQLRRGGPGVTYTPLLKSGVGRPHPWSADYPGSPGSISQRNVRDKGGATGGSLLINGRKRRFGTESTESLPEAPTGPTIA